ncbi:hypothetical protein C0995_012176 [Termitomyces sp. Mi166|nr:hypothetical protein C0995_012176 [Termitomyces sp. Mi166\
MKKEQQTKTSLNKHIKRPLNAFFLYCAHFTFRGNKTGRSKIRTQWKNEPQQAQDYYYQLSYVVKDIHKILYPHYRYRPGPARPGRKPASKDCYTADQKFIAFEYPNPDDKPQHGKQTSLRFSPYVAPQRQSSLPEASTSNLHASSLMPDHPNPAPSTPSSSPSHGSGPEFRWIKQSTPHTRQDQDFGLEAQTDDPVIQASRQSYKCLVSGRYGHKDVYQSSSPDSTTMGDCGEYNWFAVPGSYTIANPVEVPHTSSFHQIPAKTKDWEIFLQATDPIPESTFVVNPAEASNMNSFLPIYAEPAEDWGILLQGINSTPDPESSNGSALSFDWESWPSFWEPQVGANNLLPPETFEQTDQSFLAQLQAFNPGFLSTYEVQAPEQTYYASAHAGGIKGWYQGLGL